MTSTKNKIDPSAYNEFIAGLELLNVRILQSVVDVSDVAMRPLASDMNVSMSLEEEYHSVPDGFVAKQTCDFVFFLSSSGKRCGQIRCKVFAEYSSAVEINDTLFAVFKKINLRLNTWPYIREFVHCSMGRAGLPPFVLPVYRVLPSKPSTTT